MARSHEDEVRLLPETYQWGLEADVEALTDVVREVSTRRGVFIGSGGALAVARLAADLVLACTGRIATAATPLAVASMPPLIDAAAMVFTAGGRNPDVRLAVEAARKRMCRPVGIVTHRPAREFPAGVRRGTEILSFDAPAGRDGFLATNSVLGMATLVTRAVQAGAGISLPPELPALTSGDDSVVRSRCLVLTSPGSRAAALDLETRLAELGVASAEVTDWRNFAHGRHFGFSRNLESTSVVAMITPSFRELADRMLAELPETADVMRLETPYSGGAGALDLLAGGMRLAARTASARSVAAARPGVPAFGRRLYRMKTPAPSPPESPPLAVTRKLVELGVVTQDLESEYADALEVWRDHIESERFPGVVLDYDGTVCATADRFDLPDLRVREVLDRLLSADIVVGFASGRGRSLYRDLRRWVAVEHWEQIHLGLYNGTVKCRLSDPEPGPAESVPELVEFADRVASAPIGRSLKIECRPTQVSIEVAPTSLVSLVTVLRWIREELSAHAAFDLKASASGHSVDVVPMSATKASVVESVAASVEGSVLCIGDQGHFDGNDFELLASRSTTLSVDRCSSDPGRCWNLGSAGENGPELLIRYLRALRPTRPGGRFRWRGR